MRMDTRHCMRDAGIIEDQFNSGKMTGSQLKSLGAEILNDKRYTLKAVAHDTIMDLIEPGALSNADDDVVMYRVFIMYLPRTDSCCPNLTRQRAGPLQDLSVYVW